METVISRLLPFREMNGREKIVFTREDPNKFMNGGHSPPNLWTVEREIWEACRPMFAKGLNPYKIYQFHLPGVHIVLVDLFDWQKISCCSFATIYPIASRFHILSPHSPN